MQGVFDEDLTSDLASNGGLDNRQLRYLVYGNVFRDCLDQRIITTEFIPDFPVC